MSDNMYYGASKKIFQRAEELRKTMTLAEETLWNRIHINDWHLKFRRQHPIALYVVDFYSHKVKLVIELDGGIHDDSEVKGYDKGREEHLAEFGLTILRFHNDEVIHNIEEVINKIDTVIKQLLTSPLGDGGKDEGKQKQELTYPPLGDGGKQDLLVIKIGGNVIDDEMTLHSFLQEFAKIQGQKILVHGGGKLASLLAEQLGIPQQMIEGRRITDPETLKIVTMVYAGYINKNIVARLQSHQCNAVGICGADGNGIMAHKREVSAADYGFVGDIDSVNVLFFKNLLEETIIPVIAPLTHDGKGQLLNTNADTIAAALAGKLSTAYRVTLVYTFEKKGVLLDIQDENSVIKEMNAGTYKGLKEQGKIYAGMIPKLDNAFGSLTNGVKKVIIGQAADLAGLIKGNAGTTIANG
ncbi:MAG TPA: acetylglutamate kinase [Chitinophagaceae bacterium]|nr:acetylglutamate kinase [Chitinophagaceae bacterium]